MARDELLPRPPGGMGRGALLALLVHVLLVVAVAIAVAWRVRTPQTVAAELWSSVPQAAAPRAETAPPPAPTPRPAPPPAPPAPAPPALRPTPSVRDAEIAAERARQARKDAEEREAERQRRLADEARQRAAEAERRRAEQLAAQRAAVERAEREQQQRLAKLRDAQIKRMQGALAGAGAPAATGTAARDAAPSSAYVGRLVARIKPNIVFTDSVPGNPAAEVEVRAAPSGTIVARRLLRSSGFEEWDDAVLRAIDRTGTLPRDETGRVPPLIIIEFRPHE